MSSVAGGVFGRCRGRGARRPPRPARRDVALARRLSAPRRADRRRRASCSARVLRLDATLGLVDVGAVVSCSSSAPALAVRGRRPGRRRRPTPPRASARSPPRSTAAFGVDARLRRWSAARSSPSPGWSSCSTATSSTPTCGARPSLTRLAGRRRRDGPPRRPSAGLLAGVVGVVARRRLVGVAVWQPALLTALLSCRRRRRWLLVAGRPPPGAAHGSRRRVALVASVVTFLLAVVDRRPAPTEVDAPWVTSLGLRWHFARRRHERPARAAHRGPRRRGRGPARGASPVDPAGRRRRGGDCSLRVPAARRVRCCSPPSSPATRSSSSSRSRSCSSRCGCSSAGSGTTTPPSGPGPTRPTGSSSSRPSGRR